MPHVFINFLKSLPAYAMSAAAALTLAACAHVPAPPQPAPASVFVVLGENGAAVARAITAADTCPTLNVDGTAQPMALRAGPATLPLRPTTLKPEDTKPSAFPVRVCDAPLPAGARAASIAGQALPLPAVHPQRIVVIGDTGCRLNLAGREYQDCNDPHAYPFATVARAAADFKPDLVVHVGDYLYRENACPADRPGCQGSPFGFGWDAWNADFFAPATALLRAAPWVIARGNHETCRRAGQGYWRLLDPRPLQPGRDCIDPAGDAVGNHSAPYAVPLGDGAQLLVFDTSNTSYKGLPPGDPRRVVYEADWAKLARLARQAPYSIGVNHHPLLAYGAVAGKNGAPNRTFGGDGGLIDAFLPHSPLLLPDGVQVLLSGHVHLFEQLSFSSGHASQFVSGFAGTAEDLVPLPESPPPDLPPAPGAVVEAMSSWLDGFGFMTMERTGAATWAVTVRDRAGQVRNRCQIEGRHSRCEVKQVAGH